MVKEITGLTKDQAYAVKEVIDSFKKNLIVVVDEDKMTIRDMDRNEVLRGIAAMAECANKLEAIEHERFLKEYRDKHPKV